MVTVLKRSRGGLASPTPVAQTNEGGITVGHDGAVWMWYKFEPAALRFGSDETREIHARRLHEMLVELGRTGREPMVRGSSIGSLQREFHFIALNWLEPAKAPKGTPPALKTWLDDILTFGEGHGLFAVGVKLIPGSGLASWNPVAMAKSLMRSASDPSMDLTGFTKDRSEIGAILARAGGEHCDRTDLRRLELWWKGGDHRGGDCLIAMPDGRSLAGDVWQYGNLEISAMASYEALHLSDSAMWLADAFSHKAHCVAASVRGSLTPTTQVRDKFRRTQRNALRRMQEQAETADLERAEDSELYGMANELEEVFRSGDEPLLANVSVILARATDTVEPTTYLDMLYTQHGMLLKPVEHRQISALLEMLPCGERLVGTRRPFAHEGTAAVLARSGFGSMSAIGDSTGLFLGTAPPESRIVWLNTAGAAESNLPATMAILGDSGSGKTVLLQLIATQSALADVTTVMINPKPADSLDGFAKAIGGNCIKIATEGVEPGMLDPFRFAEPIQAAEIAVSHISTVMMGAIEHRDHVKMGGAFRREAESGARCVGDCLLSPDIPAGVRELIYDQAQAKGLFALGISPTPKPPLKAAGAGLTLIEFDRAIPLPSKIEKIQDLEPAQRAATAAMRLVVHSATEQLLSGSSGGVLIVDEAHVLMGSAEGRTVLERWGREGRSQRLLPILATQRVADVMESGADLESYISRVVALKFAETREATAALKMVGIKPTEEHVERLRQAGPKEGRGAMAYHRDLRSRVSLLEVGPLPPDLLTLFSTNPLDREKRSQL